MYMNTAIINIKADPRVKAKAQEVASELGFSLSALINGYLNQLVRNKAIYFSTSHEVPNEYMIQALKESGENRKNKEFESVFSVDEALKFVDNVSNGRKKS